jgi:tetratricopeptide (TPR) repeat protein
MKRCIVCLMILLFLFPVKGICEMKEIIAEGEYVMGAGETMAIAEERAMKKAAQNAAEEAGAFVKSYSKVQNMTLTEDVVEVVANHAMKITVIGKKKSVIGDLDAIKFQVKIRAVLTTEEVAANLQKVREDKGVIESYNRLKADYDRQAREMETLKKRLTESGGEEKKRVLAQITNEENRFKANLWLEKADELRFVREGGMALKAYDKAIELNPALVEAYVGRAKLVDDNSVPDCNGLLNNGPSECTEQQKKLNKALSDLNKAISLDKGHAEAYAERANVYNQIKDVQLRVAKSHITDAQWRSRPRESSEVIEKIMKKYVSRIFDDLNRAISLKPDNPEYYIKRAEYCSDFRGYIDYTIDNAISDISKVIVLYRAADHYHLSLYYLERARLYESADKKELMEKDIAKSKKIDAERGKKLSAGLEKEAKSDELWQKSEAGKLFQKIFGESRFESWRRDEEKIEQILKALNKKISQKQGEAEDYILRADLDRSKENKLRDYSEAIRLLKEGSPDGENALLLARVYLDKALAYEKQPDSALKELKEAQQVMDQHLPRAIALVKNEDKVGSDEKILKLSRSDAEAFVWMMLATNILNSRAVIYEELGLPGKAKAEYQYLCEKLNDAKACKDVERLK